MKLEQFAHCSILATCVVLLVSCTATQVRPVEDPVALTHVCVEENPKVRVHDFVVVVVRDALSRHGIRSEIFVGQPPRHCDVTLTYTAVRRWDFGPYLSHAEVRLERDGLQIGFAEYHLRGGGGFSPLKWRSNRAKMDPVLDELLAQVGE